MQLPYLDDVRSVVLDRSLDTDDIAHGIPRCIAWVSAIRDLEPGDVIVTLNTPQRTGTCAKRGT